MAPHGTIERQRLFPGSAKPIGSPPSSAAQQLVGYFRINHRVLKHPQNQGVREHEGLAMSKTSARANDDNRIGKRVRQARRDAGLTQGQTRQALRRYASHGAKD
jgi:hypothetical protein